MTIHELDGVRPELPADGEFWVAPTATIIGKVTLAQGVGVWFGTVMRGDNERIAIGADTNVQELCMFHTDMGFPLTVGKGCTIGHRAIVHGCTIGDNTLVGMGATIMNGATIGHDCLIAAGALVPEGRSVPSGSLVMGVPGKPVRQLSGEEIEANRDSAIHYVANWRRYAKGLRTAL
jgi:carbonic anhydrase/acetyltransferase-like protein (isoleucine patch superfamily)